MNKQIILEISEALSKLLIIPILEMSNSELIKNEHMDLKNPELINFLEKMSIDINELHYIAKTFVNSWISYKLNNKFVTKILSTESLADNICKKTPRDLLYVLELTRMRIPLSASARFLNVALENYTGEQWLLLTRVSKPVLASVKLSQIVENGYTDDNYIKFVRTNEMLTGNVSVIDNRDVDIVESLETEQLETNEWKN